MEKKSQQLISDEILNRIQSNQFKSEFLNESLSSNLNQQFNISNNEKLNIVSNKRQYINEIYEACKSKIIDASAFRLIYQRLDQKLFGLNKSYFEDENFLNFIRTDICTDSSSQPNQNLNDLGYNDFEKFKLQHETEMKLKQKSLNLFNQSNDDSDDGNATYDFLFERKAFQNENITQEHVSLSENNKIANSDQTFANEKTQKAFVQSNSYNGHAENSVQSVDFKPANLSWNQTPTFASNSSNTNNSNSFNNTSNNIPNSSGHKISSLKYEPRFTKCYKRKNEEDEENVNSNNCNQESSNRDSNNSNPFRSAKEQLLIDSNKTNNNNNNGSNNYSYNPANSLKKSLGTTKRGVHGKFNLPIKSNNDENENRMQSNNPPNNFNANSSNANSSNSNNSNSNNSLNIDATNLKHIDPKLVDMITSEIMDKSAIITWEDIAGLEHVKKTLKEIVIWPMLRPDIFKGLRGPPKGLLLFGPPGTGKTLIAKCIANESKSKFFSISCSSLTSKWEGESEKLVKVLFEVARAVQPSVIFIDEVDSLLSQRSDEDRESSRRLKTEFFIQMDGARTTGDERILLIGATNRPQELDDAARRRFVKRLYIPLPDIKGRKQIIVNLICKQLACDLTDSDIEEIAELTDGYSGADMGNLCKEAAIGPIRLFDSIETIDIKEVRSININDFKLAMQQVRASVSQSDLEAYYKWNSSFGSMAIN